MRKSSSTLAGSGKRFAGILSSPVRKSVTRRIGSRLLAGDTLAARNGFYDLDLFADTGVLDNTPDVDDALVADVGALEAGVIRLYGVVVILRWVRMGCARLLCGHGILSLGPRLGVLVAPPGLLTSSTAVLSHIMYRLTRIFRLDKGISREDVCIENWQDWGSIGSAEH